MESVALLIILVFMIMLGAPVGFVMILIPVIYILITDAAPMILIPSQMFSAIDSVPLTAIPFFMLTGELMTSATAFGLPFLKAFSISGARPASFNAAPRASAAMTPCNRMTDTSGGDFTKGIR